MKQECPQCGGMNLYYTTHNDFSYCFNCSYTQRGQEYHERTVHKSEHIKEIRQFYTEQAAKYHSNLRDSDRLWLHDRGFDDTDIQALQIGYCADEVIDTPIAYESGLAYKTQRLKKAVLGNRIVFPYLSVSGAVIDIRGRSLDDTEEKKYKSPIGSTLFRGANLPYNYAVTEQAKKVIITEGEIKAGIATKYGFPAIGLPGMTNWRNGMCIQEDVEYIIMLDNQRRNRRLLLQAVEKLAAHFDNPRIATLPLFSEDKADIDSFILRYGAKEFRICLDSALPIEEWRYYA